MTERLMLQIICDQCKCKETVDQKTSNQTFLQWKTHKINGKTLNFCSIKCERKYLEKTLNTKLK